MATVNELRYQFDGLSTVQKRQYILNLKKQAESSSNPEHRQFYNECVKKYNAELHEVKRHKEQSQAADISKQIPSAQDIELAKSELNALKSKFEDKKSERNSIISKLQNFFPRFHTVTTRKVRGKKRKAKYRLSERGVLVLGVLLFILISFIVIFASRCSFG